MKLFTLNDKEATVTFFLDEIPRLPDTAVGDNFILRLREVIDSEIRRRTFRPGERIKGVHGLGYVVESTSEESADHSCRVPIHYDTPLKLDVIWEIPSYVHHVREEIKIVVID